jgi:hypothetical protein
MPAIDKHIIIVAHADNVLGTRPIVALLTNVLAATMVIRE